jgi:mannose/fructose/N-acetylgalactosamine-specific phosphotransferase system component IIB
MEDELKAYAVSVSWVRKYEDEIIVVAKNKVQAETAGCSVIEATNLGGEAVRAIDIKDVTDTEEGKDAIKDHVC